MPIYTEEISLMPEHRIFRVLFLVFLTFVTVSTGLAQNDNFKRRVATLGLLTKTGQDLGFVDLTLRAPESDVPYLYSIRCGNVCPFQVGRTYEATLVNYDTTGEALIIESILIEGGKLRLRAGPMTNLLSPSRAFTCDPPLSPKGGHWEVGSDGISVCKSGRKETIKWTPDAPEADTRVSKQGNNSKKNNKNIPACRDHDGYSNATITVVITVKPAANQTWKFPEAPSTVADRILTDLNTNNHGITFKEASGALPNYRLDVTISETAQGTQQDSGWVEVTGTDTEFSESSGTAPYVGWREAVDHLSTNMLKGFEVAWHTLNTCVRPDGTVRNQ